MAYYPTTARGGPSGVVRKRSGPDQRSCAPRLAGCGMRVDAP